MKKLLLISMFGNLLLVGYLILNDYTDVVGKTVLVTQKQYDCISNWHKKKYELNPLFGPPIFNKHYLIKIKDLPSKSTFEFELSSCFYSLYSKSDLVDALPMIFKQTELSGYNRIGFYKSMDNPTIHVFADRESKIK